MNTKQLECFVQVAETLNFSLAAKKLFITQPSVSHQIQSLEDELGVQLFERHKRSVSLSVAGQIFYRDAREILTRQEIAMSRVKNTENHFATKIAISLTNNGLEMANLPQIIKKFNQIYPDVYLYFRHLNKRNRIPHLLERKMDFVFYNKAEIFDYKEIETCTFLWSPFVCLLPKHSPLAEKDDLTLDDIEEEYLIVPENNELSRLIQEVKPHISTYFYNDVRTAHILAESELGIAILPEMERIPSETCKILPLRISKQQPKTPYGLAWLKSESLNEPHSYLLELMKKEFSQSNVQKNFS